MKSEEKSFKGLFEAARKRLAYHVEGVFLEFTEEIVARMKYENVSNTELAKRLEAKPAYITKILRGSTNFTLETMVKIARALNSELRVHLQAKGTKTQWVDVLETIEHAAAVQAEPVAWQREATPVGRVRTTVTAEKEATDEALALAA